MLAKLVDAIRNFFRGKALSAGQRMPPSHTVALLIDMQDEFVRDIADETRAKMIARQAQVIQTCAEKDIPLIVLEYEGSGKTIPVLLCEIAKVPRTVTIIKEHNDGFRRTKLHKILRTFGARELVLMGVYASFCVRETAASAVAKRYGVVTADDVVADSEYRSNMEKSRGWYEANGRFLDSLAI